MTDYTELVKALRHCMTKEDGITICEPCSYYGKGIECENVLHTDAAAAIEALQVELAVSKGAIRILNYNLEQMKEDHMKQIEKEMARLKREVQDDK